MEMGVIFLKLECSCNTMNQVNVAQAIDQTTMGFGLLGFGLIVLVVLIFRLRKKKIEKANESLKKGVDKQLEKDEEGESKDDVKEEVSEEIKSDYDQHSIFADIEAESINIEEINTKLSKFKGNINIKVEDEPEAARIKLLGKITHLNKLLDAKNTRNAVGMGCYTGINKKENAKIAINFKILNDSSVIVSVFGFCLVMMK